MSESNDIRSEWEDREREIYCAEQLRDDYKEALYSERGRELANESFEKKQS